MTSQPQAWGAPQIFVTRWVLLFIQPGTVERRPFALGALCISYFLCFGPAGDMNTAKVRITENTEAIRSVLGYADR